MIDHSVNNRFNKVLVTGANGFVGQALVENLINQKIQVVRIVRDKRQVDSESTFCISDFCGQNVWQEPLLNCDTVIHLAARVHVMQDNAANPLDAFLAINLHGTVNLVQAAAKAGVKRFVFVSSIGVNGLNTKKNQNFKESDIPSPHNDYAKSKHLAEEALKKIAINSCMELVIIRPPLIYGPNPKGNFKSLINLVSKSLPIPIASIDNLRSFVFLGNLIDAIIICATHHKAAGQTYLVSDDEQVSTSQLINKIANALNKPSYLFHFPISIMRFFAKFVGKSASVDRLTQSLVVDSSKIREELGWKPPFTMDEGLKITADWYRKSQKRSRS